MNLISTTSDLKAFCKKALTNKFATIDTEFIRESTYWPQLCLIQVGLEDEAAIIDPLSKSIDLDPFFELLFHPNVIKVFHSARQDIEIFYHITGKMPTPLFDTQIAAMVCGFGDSVGYDVLVKKFDKVSIDKSSRYTNWAQRPLSEKQLAYAQADVTHLRIIYEKLHSKIVSDDRLHWLEDELTILNDPSTYVIDPYSVWQKIRVRSPKPRMLATLRELAAWREITAQQRNIPRGRVLRDDVVLELAAAAPQSHGELSRMRGLPSYITQEDESTVIIDLIRKGQQLPLEDCPQVRKKGDPTPGANALIEMLKLLLKIKAEKYHVASKLIATTSDLEVIARSSDPQVPALEGWRREVFGNAALSLKSGKVAIGIENNKIALIDIK